MAGFRSETGDMQNNPRAAFFLWQKANELLTNKNKEEKPNGSCQKEIASNSQRRED